MSPSHKRIVDHSPSYQSIGDRQRPYIRVLCIPDVEHPVGGVKQLYRHVENLIALGWDAAILTQNDNFTPAWFHTTAPSLSLAHSYSMGQISPANCILLVPETYIGVDFSDFLGFNLSHVSRVIFNQNAYYSFGSFGDHTQSLVASFYDSPVVLQTFSISENTHDFLRYNLAIPDEKLSRIVNSIEPMFNPCHEKSNLMYWMPRKNSDHVQAILHGLRRSNLVHSYGWQGQPLLNLQHSQVAEKLNSARIFLSFGHPEGFGLPVAEAMASGCYVVGYSGGGADELFRLGPSESVSFGDWTNFVEAIQRAFTSFNQNPRETSLRLQRQALAVRTLYSLDEESASINRSWSYVLDKFFSQRISSQ